MIYLFYDAAHFQFTRVSWIIHRGVGYIKFATLGLSLMCDKTHPSDSVQAEKYKRNYLNLVMELEFEQVIIWLDHAAFISVQRQFCDIYKRHL